MGQVFQFAASALPLVEIGLFLVVATQIGVANTLIIIIMSAITGAVVIRILGRRAIADVRIALKRNESPAQATFDAACVLLAGVLLIIPGFLTDFLGLLILVLPPLRRRMGALIWARVARSVYRPPKRADPEPAAAPIIDADYHDLPARGGPKKPFFPAGMLPPASGGSTRSADLPPPPTSPPNSPPATGPAGPAPAKKPLFPTRTLPAGGGAKKPPPLPSGKNPWGKK